MSTQVSKSNISERRAELLVELFFQELEPVFISRPATDEVGYDLLVGFSNDKNGVNTFAVEIKGTQQPRSPFPIARSVFDRLAHSNVPCLLLVADVKQSQLYYAWLRSDGTKRRGSVVLVPLIAIDERTRVSLGEYFRRADEHVAVA